MYTPKSVRFSTRPFSICLRYLIALCLFAQPLVQPLALMAAPPATPMGDESATAVLDAPQLLGPEDGLVATGLTHPPVGVPRLAWKPVAGAKLYYVQISPTAGFAQEAAWARTYGTTYITFGALRDGTYYWRVRAGLSLDEWGEYSEVRTFTKDWNDAGAFVPQLLSPSDGAERIAFTNDDFTWEPFQGAAQYLFEISADPTFSNIFYSEITIKSTHTPLERLPNNLYYWRVTPIDARGGYGEPSAARSFNFSWHIKPQLLSPDDNVERAFLPRFQWTAVEAAKEYELQISTEVDFGTTNSYKTTNTEYTPLASLSNDQDYFWRVKAIDANNNSTPWSEVRQLRFRWNFRAEQLAPTNSVIDQAHPFFAWTPIPGAERYQIQVDETNSYDRPLLNQKFYNVSTAAIVRFDEPTVYLERDYFWRVRGIDAQGNYTPWSDNNSFRYGTTGSPNLIYPLPYYEPDAVNTPVHGDRTIAWPLFVWDSAIDYDGETATFDWPQYYEVTVAADLFFTDIRFQSETAGLYATPTLSNTFANLEDGEIYYWRVRAYLANGERVGVDQVWKTRIDRSAPEREPTESIAPIFPVSGFNAVTTPPLLGWSPVTAAQNYRLQISKDANFDTIVEDVYPQYVNHAPWQGQRIPMPMGTYYWRVRAESAPGVALGGWSEVRYFHLAQHLLSGNQYDFVTPPYSQTITAAADGYLPELTQIASSTTTGQGEHELGDLHVMLNRIALRSGQHPEDTDNHNWIFAFDVSPTVTQTVRYVLYIDTDHLPGSGVSGAPADTPHAVTVKNTNLPEYMIVVERDDNNITTTDVKVYEGVNNSWVPSRTLYDLGGDAWYSPVDEAIQLLVPYTSLGNASGSVAVALISTGTNGDDGIFDSAPPQQNDTITELAFISNMLLPLYPFDTPLSNPIVHEDMPPLRWHMPPFDSVDGYEVEIARDALFTHVVEQWKLSETKKSSWFPFLTTTFQSLDAFEDNETYYWRVRLRHERYGTSVTTFDYGSWSPVMRFKLTSRIVGNPRVSTGELANTTPSFHWDRVDGAAGYTLQIDDDSNFSQPTTVKTDATSYTPLNQLKDGTYYWRVAMRRSNSVLGQWTPTLSFTKKSLAPTPLSPINGKVINEQPTFKWTAVLTPTSEPRIAAPLYQFQLDEDANFGSPATYKTQSTSFTIPGHKSLYDGTFYWRVAVVDASNNVGPYSEPQEFYKEYLTPKPISPVNNEPFTKATSFAWEPMDGAAAYQIEISSDPQFGRPIRATTDNTVYTPLEQLSKPQYYWRVRMEDADKNPGPWAGGLINVQEVIISLGNYVWIDANNNGRVDEGETPVPDGVLLELLDGAGAELGRTTTTTNGFYLFAGLASGEYRVRLAASNFGPEGLLKNYSHSSGLQQEADPDSDGDQNDNGIDSSDPVVDGITSAKIALVEEEEPVNETPTLAGNAGDDGNGTKDNHSNLTLDFGVVSPANTYSIGNFIGFDANNDGQIDLDDENEPAGVPEGVLLELLHGDGTETGRTTTTTNGGYYIFAGLPKGEYRVRIAASNFASGGVLELYGHSNGEYEENDPSNQGDQNDNGIDEGLPSSVGISSGVITLGDNSPMGENTATGGIPGSDGRDTPDAHSDLTIDFAVAPASPTSAQDALIFLPVVTR